MSQQKQNGGGQIAMRDTTPLTRRDPLGLANHFWSSGYFKDVKSLSQAVVKIAAGEEMGIGPMTAMTGMYIIDGKPSLHASLIGAKVKQSGRYNYRPRITTAERCEIEFYEDGESVGIVSFTIEEARKARAKENGQWKALTDTNRWRQWPEDMLFARCLTRGVRRHCPDVMAGAPAYTPEELGADVDQQGEVLSVPNLEDAPQSPSAPAEAPAALSSEAVAALVQGIEFLALDRSQLNVKLGALGIDGIPDDVDLADGLARLTTEQAEALNEALGREATQPQEPADAGEEIHDAEVVPDGAGENAEEVTPDAA